MHKIGNWFKESKIMKLVCIKEDDGFLLNEIYDGKFISMTMNKCLTNEISNESWCLEEPASFQGYKMYVYLNLDNFIPLSEYRQQQINDILDDKTS